jgi:anti-sigma regulatory factor (Ser/Thr protein kinase)
MSKRVVADAVECAGRGQLGRARQLLEKVDAVFYLKRLNHLASMSGPAASHARILIEFLKSGRAEPAAPEVQVRYKVGEVPPFSISLDDPAPFLRWLEQEQRKPVSLDALRYVEVWALVALATLAREGQEKKLHVSLSSAVASSRFAHALGFRDVVEGASQRLPGEKGRTVKLTRVATFSEIEPTASQISHLVIPDHDSEDTRRTVYYVLVELLRNVVQHSQDGIGGVAVAQVSHRSGKPDAIQVAVADAGIGIYAALRSMHPALSGPQEALEKALWPHFSGAFEEGLSGSGQNAGMGLFFIAEMTKLLAGRLMIASRGATLCLFGNADDTTRHDMHFLEPSGLGFPGTLVAFELPTEGVVDYRGLLATINDRAKERTPQRAVHRWLKYEGAPEGTPRYLVNVGTEDTSQAQVFAKNVLMPTITARKAVHIDFNNMQICTQSFLHALLYEPLRVAWALKVTVYVTNVGPAVKSSLELLERYALGG